MKILVLTFLTYMTLAFVTTANTPGLDKFLVESYLQLRAAPR